MTKKKEEKMLYGFKFVYKKPKKSKKQKSVQQILDELP